MPSLVNTLCRWYSAVRELMKSSIEPLRVIHQADERPLLGDPGQKTQHPQSYEEAIRRRSGRELERRAERIALRSRQVRQVAQHRRAELMNAGERELHFGLDSRSPRDATP
jgi:hypothetical protein